MKILSDTVDINLVVFPDEYVRKQTIAWSRKISDNFKTKFILDGKTYHPHLTLYQTRYPRKNIVAVEKRIHAFSQTIQSFSIHMDGISLFLDFLFYNAIKDNPLLGIHSQLVDLLNPLREGLRIESHTAMLTDPLISQARKLSIQKWGSPLGKGAFLPHITLSRLCSKEDTQKAKKLIQPQKLEFFATSLLLASVDHDGTCQTIFKTFPLK